MCYVSLVWSMDRFMAVLQLGCPVKTVTNFKSLIKIAESMQIAKFDCVRTQKVHIKLTSVM